ncbi:MAG: hypothetical protein ACREFR_19830 [Limisphaerales bacterium]
MKVRNSIIWFCAAVIILMALIIWFGKKPAEMPLSPAAETNTTEQAIIKPNQAVVPIVKTNAPVIGTNVSKMSTQDKNEQIREGLATLNDVPIAFYGRLEDQFGDPVIGAQISGVTIIRNGTKSGAERVSTMSDGNGFFQLNAGKGESLGVTPHKKGYVLATTDTSFDYSYMYADRFTPDQNNPTVIKMWKLQGAEPLVKIDKTYKLHYTAAQMNFDLLAGQIVPSGGDVRITVNRPTGEVSEHNPQKWSIDFEVIDGGFIETSSKESAVTFAAPEGDYQPSGTFGNNNGTDELDKNFFVESRNGQVFSKLYLSLGINNKPDGLMYITLHGVANTNSSRNWEATAPTQ